MMLFINENSQEYSEDKLKNNLAMFTSTLLLKQKVSACLATLVSDDERRNRLLSFLSSFKRASGKPAYVLIKGANLRASDLEDCEKFEIDEVVILQENDEQDSLIEILQNHQRRQKSGLSFRIWLSPQLDNLNRSFTVWKQSIPSLSGIELAPFTFGGSNGHLNHKSDNKAKPLICEWLRHIVMIDESGVITPCPKHELKDGVPIDINHAEIVSKILNWQESMGAHPVCQSCHQLTKFMIPEWMKVGVGLGNDVEAQNLISFNDYVKLNVEDATETEVKSLVKSFIGRVRANMNKVSKKD